MGSVFPSSWKEVFLKITVLALLPILFYSAYEGVPMKKTFLTVLSIILLAAGCATGVDKIAQNPSRYADKAITVTGSIGTRLDIPFTEVSIINLVKNESSGILVHRGDRSEIPRTGEVYTVRVMVLSIDGDSIEKGGEGTLDQLRDFLVEYDISDKKTAESIVGPIFTALRQLSKGLDKVFLMIEVE
jgi:hypothetical protein